MSGPKFDENESPLARLATRRGKASAAYLDDAEAEAGERLRADFTRAGLTPRVSQSWDWAPRAVGRAPGAADLSDNAMDAKRRLNDAMDAVGPELAGLLLDVCCFLKGLETVERERQWPVRSAKLMLKTGLAILARHYGLCGGGGREGRVRRWGAPDYKPSVTRSA